MNVDALRRDTQRWGLARAMYARLMPRLEALLSFRVFVIHARALNADAPLDALPEGSSIGVLGQQELLAFAEDSHLDLSSAFVLHACARGDLCFGYVERGELVAYVWVGVRRTPAEAGLWVEFATSDVYSYKAFTRSSHRGRRLQQCLANCSDRWLTAHGYFHNVDYIQTHNIASIIADRGHGNRAIGYAGYLQCFGRIHCFRSPGVVARGFRFVLPPRR